MGLQKKRGEIQCLRKRKVSRDETKIKGEKRHDKNKEEGEERVMDRQKDRVKEVKGRKKR